VKKEKMKTTTRLVIGIVAIAMVLAIAFSGVASASQPVCPPPETDQIRTVTMISCQGMVAETEKVSWETSNEDLINNPPLAGALAIALDNGGLSEVVGKMDYYQDLKVTDGITTFIKDMDVDTGDEPNLNVMQSIGYGQGATIGSLSHDEEVGFGIVADWTRPVDVILCPFAQAAQKLLPASCVDVEASSSMVVTEVLATTVTKVEISESPLDLHYEVDATGLGGAGTPAVGHIAAEFEVYTEDGSGMGNPQGGGEPGHCDQGFPVEYTLGSKLSHYERSSANGMFEFQKVMDYTSVIRPAGGGGGQAPG
jgi:preprotein translocase subunit SecE